MHPSRSQKNTVPARPRRASCRAPRFESLEDRRLLAVGPDGFGYRGDATPLLDYDLVRDAEGVVTIMDEGTADEFATQINLGAETFNFYGENHSLIFVSSNGLITMGGGNSAHLNSNLTNTPPQRAIAPFWDDLITKESGNSAVLYTLEDRNNNGTPERLIIEWQNVRGSQVGTDENPITFQAILELNTGSRAGDIYFNYIDVDAGIENEGGLVTNGALATVGIKNAGIQSTDPSAHRLLVSLNQNNNPLIGSGKAVKVTTTVDATPPTISSGTFDAAGMQPMLTIQFSEDVGASLEPTDLELFNSTTNAAVTPPAPVYNAQTNTAVYTLDPATLPDGNYRATLRAGSITDTSGNATTQDLWFEFYVLAGDADRDRSVNFNDLAILAQNYNTSGKTFAQGNFNYDAAGNVNFDDLALLAQRYNMTLMPPPPAPAAAPAPAAPSVAKQLTSAGPIAVFSTRTIAPKKPAPARRR